MAIRKLTQDESGQEPLQKHLNWPEQPSPVDSLDTVMKPSLEMFAFQRKFRTRQISLVLAQGENSEFVAVVPNDETWLIHWIFGQFVDPTTTTHLWSWDIVSPRAQSAAVRFTRMQLGTGVDTCIYPTQQTSVVDTNSVWAHKGTPPVVALPNDIVHIDDLSAVGAVGGGTSRMAIRYEIIPNPLRNEVDEVWTGTAV